MAREETEPNVFIISPLKGLEDYGGGCKAVDGQFISMDPSSVNSINIMDIRVPDDEDAKDMDEYSAGSLLTKKIHTIKSFMHLVVKDLTQEEEQLIDTCLITVYKKFGITNDNNSIYDRETGQYKKMPLLQDLHKEMLKYQELHRISNILNPLITGSMACYNRPTNVDLKAKYIVFDFNGMKGAILTMSMFVVLDFVWTKIKEDRKKRKAVFIDECWKLIGTDSNEMAAEDVVEIFRTIGENQELVIHGPGGIYKSDALPNANNIIPTFFQFGGLRNLQAEGSIQFMFLGITENATFDDVLKTMSQYGEPVSGWNYDEKAATKKNDLTGTLNYWTDSGYNIEFYFDNYGTTLTMVSIAYNPEELANLSK